MKIISSKEECESLFNSSGIMTSSAFKKLLNDNYNPDDFLFFIEDGDVLPLVNKNGLVSFYGGKISNEYNIIPYNKLLLTKAINYLQKNNLKFKLLSIKYDIYSLLNQEHQKFDVPINLNWVYTNIQDYNFFRLIEPMKQKKRTRFRKWNSLIGEQYKFVTVNKAKFLIDKEEILNKQINSFNNMRKGSGWKGKEELFFKIIYHFTSNYETVVRYLFRDNELVGMYFFVIDEDSIVIYFAGYFDREDHKITTLIYLDKLETAKKIASTRKIKIVDALRGSFTYKKRMGFSPRPLYALVNDDSWDVIFSDDLSIDEYHELFHRKFGCEESNFCNNSNLNTEQQQVPEESTISK